MGYITPQETSDAAFWRNIATTLMLRAGLTRWRVLRAEYDAANGKSIIADTRDENDPGELVIRVVSEQEARAHDRSRSGSQV
jgi:hypothetical protein